MDFSPQPQPQRINLFALGGIFLYLGTIAFGGLGSALALFQRELVDKRAWLTAMDVKEALAFTKPLPGSTVVQVVAFIGWRLGRFPGAVIAALAFIVPSALVMTSAAALTVVLPSAAWIDSALLGLQVTVIGLLAAAMWRLARSEARTYPLTLVLLVSFGVGLVANAALVVIGAGLLGVLMNWRTKRV